MFIRKVVPLGPHLQRWPFVLTSSQFQQFPCFGFSLQHLACQAFNPWPLAVEPISMPPYMPSAPPKLARIDFSEVPSTEAELERRFAPSSVQTSDLASPVKVVCDLTPVSLWPRPFDAAPAEGATSSGQSLSPGQTGSPLAIRLQEPSSLKLLHKEVVNSASVCDMEVDWIDEPCIVSPSNPEQPFAPHVFLAMSGSMDTQSFDFTLSAHLFKHLDHLFITCCL